MTDAPTSDAASVDPHSIPADRGISPVQSRFGGRPGKLVAVASLLLGCGVFLAATWDRGGPPDRNPTDTETPPRQITPFEAARRTPALLQTAAADPSAPTLGPDIPPLQPEPGAAPAPARSESRQSLADSARRAPVMAYTARQSESAALSPPSPQTSPPQTSEPGSLQSLRRVDRIDRVAAGRLPDRNLLIAAGSAAPCILQTAMDSTTPGYVSCVLPRDVYSDNGAVILMERGTRVMGEYRGGLQQGRRRLFVLWTRAVTPTGVTVSLASPATDALGRAGFDGVVDTRFWDRFGAALLLSLVDDGVHHALGDERSAAMGRLPPDPASVALQGSIDIPATLQRAQGSEVMIFVAQDLDFRDVYSLRAR